MRDSGPADGGSAHRVQPKPRPGVVWSSTYRSTMSTPLWRFLFVTTRAWGKEERHRGTRPYGNPGRPIIIIREGDNSRIFKLGRYSIFASLRRAPFWVGCRRGLKKPYREAPLVGFCSRLRAGDVAHVLDGRPNEIPIEMAPISANSAPFDLFAIVRTRRA